MRYPLTQPVSRTWIQRFFDNSLGFILLSVALTIMAGMLLMMLLSSCSAGSKKKDAGPREIVTESLMLLADRPESVKVLAFSSPDSVYGKCFFSNEELMSILDNVTAFNERIFGKSATGINLDDPKIAAKIERGAAVSEIFQRQILDAPPKGEFSGWKLKVLYECSDEFDDVIRNERYFIFSKDMNHILHTFEIPIL